MMESHLNRVGLEIQDDYDALHTGAALVDLSDRGRMRFSGKGAKSALNGVLSCDLESLTKGQGAFGVALTNRGKVVADVVVYDDGDSLVVECPAPAWPGWQQLVAKYINPRLAARTDETETTGELGIFGAGAAAVVELIAGVSGDALQLLEPYAHLKADGSSAEVDVARIPDLGVAGFRLVANCDVIEDLRTRAIAAGARAVSNAAVDCARIEAGRPAWGIDMDDSTLPQEANLEALGAISYTKGCYTGQEVVARLHFRGHVNRRLMGLRIEGPIAPERGSAITADEDKSAGETRSAAVSPRFGAIALAMVRKEVVAGETVRVEMPGGPVSAEVVTLPFGG
jgi:folate-binding protein YgfZ